MRARHYNWHCALLAGLQVLLRLNLAQLDDMQHGSTFPVVLLPADKGVAEDSAADPLLFFTHVTQPSRYRGVIYTPTLVGHIAALRIQLSETLVWRLYSFTQGLAAGRSSSGETSSTASSSAAAAASGAGAGGQLGRPAASGSRGRLVQAGSSTNLAAAGAGGNSGGSVGRGSGDVQQVASADLPLQVTKSCLTLPCERVTAPAAASVFRLGRSPTIASCDGSSPTARTTCYPPGYT